MRIAYLVNQYPKVSHTFIRREILALESSGAEISRFAIRGWDEQSPTQEDSIEQSKTHYVLGDGLGGLVKAFAWLICSRFSLGIKALRFALSMAKGAPRPWPIFIVYWLEAAWLAQRLQHGKIEQLHAHFGTNAAAVAAICRVMGGPSFSFTVHGPEEFDNPQGLHLREKAALASHVFAVSSFGRSQLFRWVRPEDWHKVSVVRCGLDEELLDASVGNWAAGSSFVCVGRLCEQKGQLLLVKAFALLAKGFPNSRLILAGDGEMRGEIEALVRSMDLESRVQITGWVSGERVSELLRSSRAMVLPSFAEGLPVVIMEAMAAGTPVISTYVAGIPELVVPGETGALIPAGDIEALANAMRLYLSGEAPLALYAKQGKQRVGEMHRASTIAKQLLQLWTSHGDVHRA